jgi:twitching motility protein PilI
MPAEWVGIGFRIGDEQFVSSREQVREVLMLPDSMTRVPGARRWLLGIANLRGHLLPLVDLKLLLGSGRTTLRRTTRVISVNHREIPAGLVVDEVQGFRRFMDQEFSETQPQTAVRCERFLAGEYRRGDDNWPVFDLFAFVESNLFLQAADE